MAQIMLTQYSTSPERIFCCRNVLRMHMSRDHRSKGHMDQMPKAEEAKHYLKVEPIQHQRILQQQIPAIQYNRESSPILKAPTIKQMVQQTMKQEVLVQQKNHVVIEGEQQQQKMENYKQQQQQEEEEEEVEDEVAGHEGEMLEVLGPDIEEEEEEIVDQQT